MNKEKLKKELAELSELEDNWDSYGAPPFTKETIDKVDSIIDHLDDRYEDPDIVPNPTGIQLEWNRALYDALEISVEGIEVWVLQIVGERMKDWIDREISDLSEINEFLEDLYGEENE